MTTVRQLLDRKDRAVFSVGPEAPVLEAIRAMADHHVGALLVMSGEVLAGIVSERVIDELESIEVQKQHRANGSRASIGTVQRCPQAP